MAYSVIVSKAAERQLLRLPRDVQPRVRAAIDGLAANPRPPGSQKLSGVEQHRIRIGDYRVIYEIMDAELNVLVVRAGRRDSVY